MNAFKNSLSKLFSGKNVSKIVFEWQEEQRICLISFFIVLELLTQWIGYTIIWFNGEYFDKWVNGDAFAMLWFISGQILLVFIWIAIIIYRRLSLQTEDKYNFMQYSVATLYTVYSVFTYMTIGLVNILTGVGIVASTIIAMLLLNRRVALQTFALHVFLICILVALPANDISVPNIYKNITPFDEHYKGSVIFWHIFYLYLSLPKAVLSIFISLFLIKGIEAKLQEVQYQANYDKLTKVTNRRYIMQYLFEVLFLSASKFELDTSNKNKKICHALSVVLLDIDFFKSINDTYGHLSGDMVLIELARRLKKSVANNIGWEVCRHGGEEFLIVLPHCSHREAMAFTGTLKKEVCTDQYRIVDNMSINVTASFGVATFEDHEVIKIRRNYYATDNKKQAHQILDLETIQESVSASQEEILIESLINKADNALYDAKRLGRNRIISANQYVDETSSHSSIEINAIETESILQHTDIEKFYDRGDGDKVEQEQALVEAESIFEEECTVEEQPAQEQSMFEEESVFRSVFKETKSATIEKESVLNKEKLFVEEDVELFLDKDNELFLDKNGVVSNK